MLAVNLDQLRVALKVAEQVDRELRRASETDSVQIHLYEPEDTLLGVRLLSNEAGQTVRAYTIDLGQAPGETGTAEPVA